MRQGRISRPKNNQVSWREREHNKLLILAGHIIIS
jgi:hypothetical protein